MFEKQIAQSPERRRVDGWANEKVCRESRIDSTGSGVYPDSLRMDSLQ
jgi:hypothetical protein